MKPLSKILITVTMLFACGSALAARDEALINATRKNQLRHDARLAAQQAAASRAPATTVAASPGGSAH